MSEVIAAPALNSATLTLPPLRVLIVEDAQVMRHVMKAWLAPEAWEVRLCADLSQANTALAESAWDVLMADLTLSGDVGATNGLDLIERVRQQNPEVACVLLTAHGEQQEFSRAVRVGVQQILIKPFLRAELLNMLKRLDEARHTRAELAHARQELARQQQELAHLHRRERRLGALAQKYLLVSSDHDQIRGVKVSSAMAAQDSASGDLLDIVQTGDCVDVVNGDVMGKGLGAALVAAGIRNALAQARLNATGVCTPNVHQLFEQLRQRVDPMLREMQALLTLMFARIDLAAATLTLIDCGAPKLLLQRAANGHVVCLSGAMMPLGICDEPISSVEIPLYPGDRLLFISDGVVDACGQADAGNAYRDIARIWHKDAGFSDEELVATLTAQVFSEQAVLDDRSAVVVRVGEQGLGARVIHRARFARGLDSIAPAREWALRVLGPVLVAAQVPDPEGWQSMWQIGFVEALSNVLRHLGKNALPGECEVVLAIDPGDSPERGVWLELNYAGLPFAPPAKRAMPQAHELKESGYGLPLIDSVFDRVAYFTDSQDMQSLMLWRRF